MPQMVERVSAVEHVYAGRAFQVGERFQCELNDVRLMLALGRIAPQQGDPGYLSPSSQEYRTRDLSAAGRGRRKA